MKALIIVDMLNDFARKGGVLYFEQNEKIIPNIEERLEEAEANMNTIVIYLCDAHEEDDEEFDRFPPHAVDGTEGAEIIEELAPNEEDAFVLGKTRYSGFYGTDLGALLRLYEVHEVTVVGCCTSICVMDTVGGLANRDYKIVVPKNAVADFDPEAHEAALKRMEVLYGAKVV